MDQVPVRFFSEPLADALRWSAELHAGDRRKGTRIPYIAHPLAVASIVLELGGSLEEVIAALLHDVVEDCKVPYEDIEQRFGPRVRRLVESATDAPPGSARGAATWHERKERYLKHLETMTEDERRLAIADKVHNARSMLADHGRLGDAFWTKFNAPREDQLWYYGGIVERLRSGGSEPQVEELAGIVERLARPLGSERGAP